MAAAELHIRKPVCFPTTQKTLEFRRKEDGWCTWNCSTPKEGREREKEYNRGRGFGSVVATH